MPSDIARILHAASFAADRHRNQRRKDARASPYINHPLDVAEFLASECGIQDPEVLIGALLHDTVEDTDTSLEEIAAQFGASVAGVVREVTDDKKLAKKERKRLQVETAPGKSDNAKQIKIADKICNVRDIDRDSPTEWEHERKTEYLDWAAQVVEGCRGVNADLDRHFDSVLRDAHRRLA